MKRKRKIYGIFVTFPDGATNISQECYGELSDAKKFIALRADKVYKDGWAGISTPEHGGADYKIKELIAIGGE